MGVPDPLSPGDNACLKSVWGLTRDTFSLTSFLSSRKWKAIEFFSIGHSKCVQMPGALCFIQQRASLLQMVKREVCFANEWQKSSKNRVNTVCNSITKSNIGEPAASSSLPFSSVLESSQATSPPQSSLWFLSIPYYLLVLAHCPNTPFTLLASSAVKWYYSSSALLSCTAPTTLFPGQTFSGCLLCAWLSREGWWGDRWVVGARWDTTASLWRQQKWHVSGVKKSTRGICRTF